MIKVLSQVGIERAYLNIIKARYQKPSANIILMGKTKTKSIFLKLKNKTRVSTLHTLIQHSTGNPNHSNKKRKRKKRHSNKKGGSKTVIIHR